MSSADTSYPNGYKVTALGGIVGLNLLTLQAALGNIQDATGVAAPQQPNVQILGGVLTDDPVNHRTLIKAGASVLTQPGRFLYSSAALPATPAVVPGTRGFESFDPAGIVVDAIGGVPSFTDRIVGGVSRHMKIIGNGNQTNNTADYTTAPFGSSPDRNVYAGNDPLVGSLWWQITGPVGAVVTITAPSPPNFAIYNMGTLALMVTGANPGSVTIPASGGIIISATNAPGFYGYPPYSPSGFTISGLSGGGFTELVLPGGFLYTIAAELTLAIQRDVANAASGSVGMVTHCMTDAPPTVQTIQRISTPYHYSGLPAGDTGLIVGISADMLVQPGDTSGHVGFNVTATGPNPNSTYILKGATMRIQQVSLA